MRELTPRETLQAIIDGKKVESRGVIASCNSEWRLLNEHNTSIDVLTSGLFMFRLAQETITVGDVSFPMPESEPLKGDEQYWVAAPTVAAYTASVSWTGDQFDKWALSRGLVHRSKENAIAHAKALIKLSGGSVND